MSSDVIKLTQDLVAIPSVSQQSNAEVSDYIEDWLRGHGFDEIERLEYDDDYGRKVNVIAKKGEGTGGVAFLSHSDTVRGMPCPYKIYRLTPTASYPTPMPYTHS